MRLASVDGDALELCVDGYQFPEAEDPRKRFSWHMVRGRAQTRTRTWDFRWQALACDESPRLARWLRSVAHAMSSSDGAVPSWPPRAKFTEPNLAFEVESCQDGVAVIRVELDLEFRSPENRAVRSAGSPDVLRITATTPQLLAAATSWEADLARYPGSA